MQTEINTTMKNLFGKIKSLLSRILGKNKGEDRSVDGALSHKDDDEVALKKGEYDFEGQLINDIAGYIAKCKEYDGPLHAKAFRALYIYKRCLEKKEKDEKYISESIGIKSDGSLACKYKTDLKEEFGKLETTFKKNKILEKMKEDYTFLTSIHHSWDFIRALEKGGGDIIYLYHFKTLFELSAEDGEISLSELLHIRGLMRKYISDREGNANSDLSDAIKEATMVIKNAKKEDEIEKYFKEGEEAIDKNKRVITRWFLKDLIVLAYADGKCDRNEYKKLKKLSDEYKVAEGDFVDMLMDVDRISYTPVERLKKDYWENELDPSETTMTCKIWFAPLAVIAKTCRVCLLQSPIARILTIFGFIFIGVLVYCYSMGDEWYTAFIESTSSFFRSYGGYRGEIGELDKVNKGKWIYYVFQWMTVFIVAGFTYFHFGKELKNDLIRKCAILPITFNKNKLFDILKDCLGLCKDRKKLILTLFMVVVVLVAIYVWLSCEKSTLVKDERIAVRINIPTNVVTVIDGCRTYTNRLDYSYAVFNCNTNGCIVSIVDKVNNKEENGGIWKSHLSNLTDMHCFGFVVLLFYVYCLFSLPCLLYYWFRELLPKWKSQKLYVIWGGVSNGELREEAITLMADIKRTCEGSSVLIMIDKDTVEKERYDGITSYLKDFNVCWKYVSYGRLDKYDAYGNYHFFIDKDGRKNRVTAQSVIDRLKQDNEDRLIVMPKDEKPQLHVLVKHSTEHDLSNWLNNPVVRDVVDLRIFNVAEIVSDDLFQQVDCSLESKNEIKILFLGMGRNSRAIMRKMFLIPDLIEKEMKITICESNNENRWRFLLYLLDILKVINEVHSIEFFATNHGSTKASKPRKVLEELNRYNDFYNDGKNECAPMELMFKINRVSCRLIFENLDVLSAKFKVWALNNMFYCEETEEQSDVKISNSSLDYKFKYDYVFSCLGDSHNSLTTMRRVERIYCRETGKKGLPGGKYFMQLKDSRYASMYESKINGDISVFGDLRRVFSLIRIKGRYERVQLQEILKSRNSNITSLRNMIERSDLNDLLSKVSEDIQKFLNTSVGRIFIEYCYVYKRYCVLYSVKIHEVLLRIYCLLLIGDKNNAIKSDLVTYIAQKKGSIGQKSGTANPNAEIKNAQKKGSVGPEPEANPNAVIMYVQEKGSVGQKFGTANPNAVIMDVQEKGSVGPEPEANPMDVQESGSVGQKSGTANPNAVIMDVQESGSVGQKSGTDNPNAVIMDAQKKGSVGQKFGTANPNAVIMDVQESGSVGQKFGTANPNAVIMYVQEKGSVGPEPEANPMDVQESGSVGQKSGTANPNAVIMDVQESGSVGQKSGTANPNAVIMDAQKKGSVGQKFGTANPNAVIMDVQESGSGETKVILESPKDGGCEIVLSEKYDYCVFIMYCSIAGGNIIEELKVRQ